MLSFSFTLFLLLLATSHANTANPQPKIIVQLIIDDLGHADTTLNPDVTAPDVPTPHLQKLLSQGVRLTNMHSQPVCSPTRSSLMTGRFPFRMGMQHTNTIMPGSTAAIPLTTPTVPELLPSSFVVKAAVGKWHLGYASTANIPTSRGFDHFVGYLQGQVDYYNKTIARGFDFWDGPSQYRKAVGNYSLPQYMSAVEKYLNEFTNKAKTDEMARMYLYLSHQTVHIPLEAAGEDSRCGHINDYWRRVYCSMLVGLDDSIGHLTSLLDAAVGDDWVVLCMGDNGGMVRFRTDENSTSNEPFWPASAGDNRPLRGSKTTLFQGGVKATAFVSGSSSMIPVTARGTSYDGLMHACDFAATVLGLGGVDSSELAALSTSMDGLDHWSAIVGGQSRSLRDHVPINLINNGTTYSAIRYGDFKLIVGSPTVTALADGWFQGGLYPAVQKAPVHTKGINYLFNVTRDPYEHEELDLEKYKDIVQDGLKLIRDYVTHQKGDYQEPQPNRPHLKALPIFHGGAWVPFL